MSIQEPLSPVHKYYLDGYYTHKFSEKKSSKINELIQEIMTGNIRKGFSLVSKYSETADLRPFAADYDEEILDFLIKTGAYDILRKLTGQDLYLYHAQLRITSPSSNLNEKESYMDWHRDSYYKGGKRIPYSNDQVVIFNAAALHAAAVNQEFNRARLIYSFLTKDQLETAEEQHKTLGKTFYNKIT
jgi:hypothetical protein